MKKRTLVKFINALILIERNRVCTHNNVYHYEYDRLITRLKFGFVSIQQVVVDLFCYYLRSSFQFFHRFFISVDVISASACEFSHPSASLRSPVYFHGRDVVGEPLWYFERIFWWIWGVSKLHPYKLKQFKWCFSVMQHLLKKEGYIYDRRSRNCAVVVCSVPRRHPHASYLAVRGKNRRMNLISFITRREFSCKCTNRPVIGVAMPGKRHVRFFLESFHLTRWWKISPKVKCERWRGSFRWRGNYFNNLDARWVQRRCADWYEIHCTDNKK